MMKRFSPADYKLVDVRLNKNTKALLLIGSDRYYLIGFNLSKASCMRYKEAFKSGNLSIKDTMGIWPVTHIKCLSWCELS